jgi:hypothetical protein
MKVDYAFVSESADSQAGLFYVVRGGADMHFLPRSFPRPLRLGAISFVVRLLGEPHEIGQTYPLTYTIVNSDGQTVNFRQNVEARFDPHPVDPTRTTATVAAFRFYGFPVPDFGTYLFEVLHGEERLAQVPFWVLPVDDQDGQDGPPGPPEFPEDPSEPRPDGGQASEGPR